MGTYVPFQTKNRKNDIFNDVLPPVLFLTNTIEFGMLETTRKTVSAKICDKKSNVLHPNAQSRFFGQRCNWCLQVSSGYKTTVLANFLELRKHEGMNPEKLFPFCNGVPLV